MLSPFLLSKLDLGSLLSGTVGFVAIAFVFVLLWLFTVLAIFLKYYKRCPSNRILVIYGKTARDEAAYCIAGGATLVKPLIQDYAWLSLEPMQIEIPLRGAPSIENIPVDVPSVFIVAIGTSKELMNNAAIRLLGLSSDQIKKQAEEIIFGQLRQLIASMQIEDIKRDTFPSYIQNSLEPELGKIGLVLINVNITEITGDSSYMKATTIAALRKLLEERRLSEEDRQEIRRLLDATGS